MTKDEFDEDQQDTDYTDEQGGGGAEDELTEDEFEDALKKASRKLTDEELKELDRKSGRS